MSRKFKAAAAAATTLVLAGLLTACTAPLEESPEGPKPPGTNHAQTDEPKEPAEEPVEVETPAEKEGTFKNPFPVGTPVGNDEVNFAITGAPVVITKEQYIEWNQFNDDPVNGQFVMVPVSVQNLEAPEPITPWLDITLKLVAPDGRSWEENAPTGLPGDLRDVSDLYPGGSAKGYVAFDIDPAALVPGLMMTMSYNWSEEVFISVL